MSGPPVVAATYPLPLDGAPEGVVTHVAADGLADLAARRRLAGLIVRSECPLDAGLVRKLPDLRFVVRAGSGTDAIDLAALAEHGVEFVRNPGPAADAVAELALAGLLALTRRVPVATAAVRRGEHVKDRLVGEPLTALTAAVWGSGPVGRAVTAVLRRWGVADVRFVEARPGADGSPPWADEAVAAADVHVACLPLVPATRWTFDARFFDAVRHTRPYLCNIGRYDLVDTPAAAAALAGGGLRGLYVDPVDPEHLAEARDLVSRLDGHNALFTQHQGAQRRDVRARLDTWALAEALQRLDRLVAPQEPRAGRSAP